MVFRRLRGDREQLNEQPMEKFQYYHEDFLTILDT